MTEPLMVHIARKPVGIWRGYFAKHCVTGAKEPSLFDWQSTLAVLAAFVAVAATFYAYAV
jgi:hypothetical protein